jgi:hypothetical protein
MSMSYPPCTSIHHLDEVEFSIHLHYIYNTLMIRRKMTWLNNTKQKFIIVYDKLIYYYKQSSFLW